MLYQSSLKTHIVAVLAMAVICLSNNAYAQFGGNTGGGRTPQGGGTTGGLGGQTGQGGQTGIDVGQELGAQNLNAADGTLSAQVGQNVFVGQGNDGFIGNRNAGQANTGAGTQFGNLGQTNNNRPQNQTNTQRKQLRPQLRIAFDVPPIPQQQVLARVSAEVIKLPQFASELETFNVSVNETGVATLSGRVDDEHTLKLLEAYVRMEPGVRNVVNELVVTP